MPRFIFWRSVVINQEPGVDIVLLSRHLMVIRTAALVLRFLG